MSKAQNSISTDVGLLAAAMVAPGTLQKSMIERDALDQGVASGLSMALAFTIAILMQDGIESVSNQFIDEDSSLDSNVTGLIASACAIAVGCTAQAVLRQKDNETTSRSVGRTLSYWLAVAGMAGATLRTLGILMHDDGSSRSIQKEISTGIFIFPLGVLLALLFDFTRYRRVVNIKDNPLLSSPLKAVGTGIALIATLTTVSKTEKLLAGKVQTVVDTHAKPLSKGWLPIGHLLSSALFIGGFAFAMTKLFRKIESSQDAVEDQYSYAPSTLYSSGGQGSFIDWSTLSLQGRRHIGTRINKDALNHDLNITSALDPIRIYVGLDSAPTEEDRVALALAEIDRTNALDRKYLVLVAPTGTGYVNYVMSDTVEYLSKGNCAMVTMQYSKRPSPLSLDRVDEGYIQFRILINALAKRLRVMSVDKRPIVTIFGESLGAWVSQDAFLHSGTDGLIANGIDRALWIGTPELSKWQEHVSAANKLNVDSELVGRFDNITDYKNMPRSDRLKLRYVMCTHFNDPVSQFSLSLLFRAPKWLRIYEDRPSSLPQDTRYRTPTTFVHRVIDMKNALKPKPGVFTSVGHDYRADLLGFINEVYGFHYSDEELKQINTLLVRNDKNRGNM